MRRTRLLLLGSLVGCLPCVGAASADDPPAAEEAPIPADRELRLFHVGALTRRSPDHRIDRGPFPVPVEEVNDEKHPLYGGESEEWSAAYGSVDDVIELVKSSVPDAVRLFSGDGVSIAAIGTRIISVRGPRVMLEGVAAVLAEFERRDLATISIDVLALRGEAASAKEGRLESAVARGALVPLAGARATGFAPRTITARTGSDRAYVQDEDVEVAKAAHATDPAIGVAKLGLAFSAAIQRATAEHVNVRLNAWCAKPEPPTLVAIRPSDAPLETVVTDGRSVEAVLDLVPGRWSVVAGSGDVTFAVRASVRPHDAAFAAATSIPTTEHVPKPPFSIHEIAVADLARKIAYTPGEMPVLLPSGYAPVEPPELPEAAPEFPTESLIETLRYWTPSVWGAEGTSIDWKNGSLYSNADDATNTSIVELLNGIRTGLGRTTRVRALVVSLPLASIPEYWTGLDESKGLLADEGKTLLSRAGARVVDRSGVLCRPGQRSASVAGKRHSYVGDYGVMVAESSAIGEPVKREVLEGFSFDVESRLAAGGAAVCCDLRLDRTTWSATRQVKTPYGDLECPTLGVSRMRGGAVVPIGASRIVAATLENGVVTLTIVSATAE